MHVVTVIKHSKYLNCICRKSCEKGFITKEHIKRIRIKIFMVRFVGHLKKVHALIRLFTEIIIGTFAD